MVVVRTTHKMDAIKFFVSSAEFCATFLCFVSARLDAFWG